MLTPGGRTIKACRENLISNLKDRDSYRQDSNPKVIQEEPDQPKVWGWYYNAKNSMGGYGDGREILCYQEQSGRVIHQSFGIDDAGGRRLFLAATSPKIKKEIAEKAAAEAKAKAESDAKAARIYNRSYSELIAWCNAKAKPHSNRILRERGWLASFDLSQYRMKRKTTVDWHLTEACKTMNKEHTNDYGDKTPAPEAFKKGLVKFSDAQVENWSENRSAICKVEPQFCR